jgi:hypothetical protein
VESNKTIRRREFVERLKEISYKKTSIESLETLTAELSDLNVDVEKALRMISGAIDSHRGFLLNLSKQLDTVFQKQS